MDLRRENTSDLLVAAGDPRLLDKVGREYAIRNGIMPLRRVGALTLVAARDMWARIETVDHLEARLGPVTFVPAGPARH